VECQEVKGGYNICIELLANLMDGGLGGMSCVVSLDSNWVVFMVKSEGGNGKVCLDGAQCAEPCHA